ncbi:MAG: endolytic transglycosylase MltG [Deltaproteobacteria bacterium]|nr:endolytic transglycosylase MltG [Deltaproteobacteria bacterium]
MNQGWVLRFVKVVAAAGSFVGFLVALNFFIYSRTPATNSKGVNLVLERGMSLSEIIQKLEKNDVVENGELFKWYMFLDGAASRARAGDYYFRPGLTPHQVVRLLMTGDFKVYEVRIPEGWNLKEVADYLAGMQLIDKEKFLARCHDAVFIQSFGLNVSSLEGYLFPNTYKVYRNIRSEEELIAKFVYAFKGVQNLYMAPQLKKTDLTQEQIITLASIVEKEARRKEERPLIASVFLNRLKKGIPLAADPTVIYGIPNFNGNLTRRDLETPSPYNTYLNKGLPPGPIANPGLASIRAVLFPAETDFLYFVARGDGSHQFSRTLEEHNQAVYKYQIGLRGRPEKSAITESRPQ